MGPPGREFLPSHPDGGNPSAPHHRSPGPRSAQTRLSRRRRAHPGNGRPAAGGPPRNEPPGRTRRGPLPYGPGAPNRQLPGGQPLRHRHRLLGAPACRQRPLCPRGGPRVLQDLADLLVVSDRIRPVPRLQALRQALGPGASGVDPVEGSCDLALHHGTPVRRAPPGLQVAGTRFAAPYRSRRRRKASSTRGSTPGAVRAASSSSDGRCAASSATQRAAWMKPPARSRTRSSTSGRKPFARPA